MTGKKIPYVEIIYKFSEESPRGWDFYSLMDYLKKSGIEVPEKPQLRLGGFIGGLRQKKLERVLVFPDVYRQWFGREPRGEAERGYHKIIFLRKYKSAIDELKNLQKEAERERDIKLGKTPLVKKMIEDGELFDILQGIERENGFLDAVLLEEVKLYEEKARRIQTEIIMKTKKTSKEINKSIAELYNLHSELKEKLGEQRKEIEERRKKINKGHVS